MIHPDEALRLIAALDIAVLPDEPRGIPLKYALGRVLARVLPAAVDQPPFDKSAMDGFAWGGESRPAYAVVGTIAAGFVPSLRLMEGECARIMTGAPLPPGAERVQRVEWTAEEGGFVRFTKAESSDNVIRRGENQKTGDVLLDRRVLRPADIGILASSGYASVPVQRRPVVGVVSTGNELRAAGEPLDPGAIFDSNGPQLAAQARAYGCEIMAYGRFPDCKEALGGIVRRGLGECDLLLISGGVSMGDYDLVPEVLERNGVTKLFHNLAMKPGKPTYLGRKGDVIVLGLPGNPVSTFVNFEILGKAVLARLRGLPAEAPAVRVRLAEALGGGSLDRVEYLPARIRNGEIRPLRYTGSSMLSALSEANALIRLEIGQTRLEIGAEIDARPV
ncbi:MAG TPA: molybdopterin molybdotransferase MoeA [Magnetospirillaceae bacterium]|nr:molybdopterin molybdotransferase MoeA [Magnetospirillaceae bacterium]